MRCECRTAYRSQQSFAHSEGFMQGIYIRKTEEADLPTLLEIYNYEVENGVATLDLTPKGMDEWRAWYNAHNLDNHPLYTAFYGGEIAGYVSLSPYREKEAYKSTVELSIYVSPAHRGRGVATAMMEFILRIAHEDPRTHTVVSVITAGNAASTALHGKFGFEYCGRISEVGMKFGRYLDIENYRITV